MTNIQVFPRIDDYGNVGNKNLRREEQIKFNKKLPPVGLESGTLVLLLWHILCDILSYLTELTWQALGVMVISHPLKSIGWII